MAQAQAHSTTDSEARAPRAAGFAFLKGGSSKTTLSVNTARHLAERNGESSTLFIDMDPNGHATRNYDFGHGGLYDQETQLDEVLLGKEASVDPAKIPVRTPYKFDIIPATEKHESIALQLQSEMGGSARLRTRVVDELLGDKYKYIIIDQPSDAGIMNNNSAFASQNLVIPMLPNAETIESFGRTKDRLITPLEERKQDMNILAVVPNKLQQRIDQQTNDRRLLEAINTSDSLKDLVPDFARITAEEWEKIDAGEMRPPKPGIRKTEEITNGMRDEGKPLLDYNPENPQNDYFDELAAIIERGEAQR